ncbi:MAG TPA: hypothetical protein ENJ94_10000 [Gammaproteobacteria bacterium]|nr:hypothetical protein [Gammaproteobacteria bacterium]
MYLMRKPFWLLLPLALAACTTPPPAPERPQPPPAPKPAPRAEGLAQQLARDSAPERNQVREAYRYDRTISLGRVPGVRLYTYRPGRQDRVVGFALVNKGSRRVNPRGLRGSGARREFLFQFPDRAREETFLSVLDDVRLSRRYSHDNMFRELHFFPRRQLPSLVREGDRFRVHLPTGETVWFDARSAEIVGGVLRESPIDFNRNRHARHNPRIDYRGEGLLITVAQRGEAPRRARVWGQRKYAEVRYPARYRKTCRISPALLWDQRPRPGDSDPRLTWRLKSDEAVFDLVEKRCGWKLDALRGGG